MKILLTIIFLALAQLVAGQNASPKVQAQSSNYVPAADNCGEWTDDAPLQPILQKWLRGEKIENVPYCSKTAIKATSFNRSNVIPEFIDLDGDGKAELALRSQCSPTGNCEAVIYRRSGTHYQVVFQGRKAVLTFQIQGQRHHGYFDIRTSMHGSCCDGDYVIYRFDGRRYQPRQCGEYSYYDKDHPGKTLKDEVLTPQPCSEVLDQP